MSARSEQGRADAVARFAALLELPQRLRELADDWDEGFPGSTGGDGVGGSRGKGEHADPVLRQVMGRPAGAGSSDRCRMLADRIDRLVIEVNALAFESLRALPLEPEVASKLARDRESRFVGAGSCLACQTGVSGVGEDRLRAGFCQACNAAWSRAGRPDRGSWIVVRRVWLAERAGNAAGNDESAGDTSVVDGGGMVRGSGGVVRPEAGAA